MINGYEEIPITLAKRFAEIYDRLQAESECRLPPPEEYIIPKLRCCSFKDFSIPGTYQGSIRAEHSLLFISPRWGDAPFRVYFNAMTRKIYIDLNHSFIEELRDSVEGELSILCDIVRSIIFIAPLDPSMRNTVETKRAS